MQIIRSANGFFWGWFITLLLIGVGVLYTVILKFPQFRHFKRMFTSMFRKSSKEDGISPFSALCAAVGGQVGSGNLAGVATAIATGGPGAVFWMWIIGLVGMPTIFSEAILGQITIYRVLAILWLIVGSIMPTDNMWELADFGNALMIFPNVIGLLILSKQVKKVSDDYDKQLKVTKDPVYQKGE